MAISTGTALLASTLISAAAAGTQMAVSHKESEKALSEQKAAQKEAAATQAAADEKAETQRLEGLAANQEATNYGNIWGADSAKYKDAAQKLSAGTGSFDTNDDETNPFYARGLF